MVVAAELSGVKENATRCLQQLRVEAWPDLVQPSRLRAFAFSALKSKLFNMFIILECLIVMESRLFHGVKFAVKCCCSKEGNSNARLARLLVCH